MSTINLSKTGQSINLTKTIDLTKGTTPDIQINLNWNKTPQKKGFFSFGSSAADLDIGVLYELQDGSKDAVQALGNAFGNFSRAPYIELDGDDRSGANTEGENIRINGQFWSKIKRVLVYAFIYKGAANWDSTDAVVTISVPGEDDTLVALTNGKSLNMCGIALIENDGGEIKITRVVDYFKGHRQLDEAHNWGLNWVAGSK